MVATIFSSHSVAMLGFKPQLQFYTDPNDVNNLLAFSSTPSSKALIRLYWRGYLMVAEMMDTAGAPEQLLFNIACA